MSEDDLVFVASVALVLVGAMAYVQCEIEEMRYKLLCLELRVKAEEERRHSVYD